MPQSNFPSADPQSERVEGITFAEEAGEESPERRFTVLLSMKLWLRFAKAAAREFRTASDAAPDVSIPNDGNDLTGEDERLAG